MGGKINSCYRSTLGIWWFPMSVRFLLRFENSFVLKLTTWTDFTCAIGGKTNKELYVVFLQGEHVWELPYEQNILEAQREEELFLGYIWDVSVVEMQNDIIPIENKLAISRKRPMHLYICLHTNSRNLLQMYLCTHAITYV